MGECIPQCFTQCMGECIPQCFTQLMGEFITQLIPQCMGELITQLMPQLMGEPSGGVCTGGWSPVTGCWNRLTVVRYPLTVRAQERKSQEHKPEFPLRTCALARALLLIHRFHRFDSGFLS
jgi:hypothetical protein